MVMAADVELTPAEWRLRLARPQSAASGMPPALAEDFNRRFRRITQRVRRLHQSPRLALQESLALQPAWRRTLELLQLLAEGHSSGCPIDPADATELLVTIDRSLRLLESHLTLCDFTIATAERLHPIVEEIVHGVERSSRRLRNVGLEAAAALTEAEIKPCLAPLALFSPAMVLEQAGWARADWFAQAIMSVRLMAAVLPRLEFQPDVGTWLMTAALVQDIGNWHQPYRYRHQTVLREGRHRAEPNHPATGAAILNGLVDASAMLGLLVGTHHERVDGTGFPQRLAGSRLNVEQQTLGLIARLTELLTDPLTGQLAVDHDEPLDIAAGLRLWREVRRGSFAEPLARVCLETMRTGLADRVCELYPARVQRMVDAPHPVPAPKARGPEIEAPAESAIKPPVFLRRQRSRGGLSRTLGEVR